MAGCTQRQGYRQIMLKLSGVHEAVQLNYIWTASKGNRKYDEELLLHTIGFKVGGRLRCTTRHQANRESVKSDQGFKECDRSDSGSCRQQHCQPGDSNGFKGF